MSPATDKTGDRQAGHLAVRADDAATGIDWISAALDAMDQGEPLPQPFDGENRRAWDLLFADERIPRTTVV